MEAFTLAGGRVMSTDCGIPGLPHDDLVRALRTMQAMTAQSPVEVLRLATSTSARLLRLPDRGCIAPGQRADLLVVEGDPTRDLEALERVRAVVADGRLVRLEQW